VFWSRLKPDLEILGGDDIVQTATSRQLDSDGLGDQVRQENPSAERLCRFESGLGHHSDGSLRRGG